MTCDWHGCHRPAVNTVRKDVPRGEGFTSLIWHRCEPHTPINPEHCIMFAPSETVKRGSDDDLPGMWSYSDFTGGDPDERSYSECAS